jgi:hypothetical protein
MLIHSIGGRNQSKGNESWFFVNLSLQVTIIIFYVLKVKLLLFTITNMMIIFHLMIMMLNNLILKVDLNKFLKNASTCMRFSILQNGFYKMGYK